jgi:hypothetical protein
MKHVLSAAIMVLALALPAGPLLAANVADSVTGLPLYPSAGSPDSTQNFSLCHSQVKANDYDLLSGTDAAALTWLTAHLPGFTHTHGIGHGARQDFFMKTDGTLAVDATASRHGAGLYGLSYMRFTPAVAPADQVRLGNLMTTC